jgi:hypothetical protein
MARTQQEIYDSIKTEMTANVLTLPLVANMSKTNLTGLLAWIVAGVMVSLEIIFDAFKVEVDDNVKAAQVGNSLWYKNRVLEFQLGDVLTLVNSKYIYNPLDITKRIIARCAVEERNDSTLRIKVAKLNGTTLQALNIAELNALISYIKKIRFAGVRFQVMSNNGDILKVYFQIYYDPIIDPALIKTNVEKAINDYILNLPFNGELQLSSLTDEVQKVVGVTDVVLVSAASKFAVSDAFETINRKVIAIGGYFKISTILGETLDDTITYIANQ